MNARQFFSRRILAGTALAAAVALPPNAAIADDAYVFPTDEMRVGEVVQLQYPTLLYTARKCELQVSDASVMRFYAAYRDKGHWDTGCWTRNLAGEAVIVVPRQAIRKISMDALARADVRPGGKAYIKALPNAGQVR